MSQTFECVVIGGGLVGSAIAWGLSKHSSRVALLDEGDFAIRASRGNFGLVWVQGKGLDFPEYSYWTHQSASLWPDLAAELKELTGVDVAYSKPGGLHICLDENEFTERERKLAQLREQTDGRFQFNMLDAKSARELLPTLSPDIAGASHCNEDGHLNPLYLLRALHDGFLRQRGHYLPGRKAHAIRSATSGFEIATEQGKVYCEKLVLTAGLANSALGKMVGLNVPVKPNKGQILVTEKLAPFMKLPTLQVRQTAEGGVMIGDSHEETGMETSTSSAVMSAIAARAVTIFPKLHDVKLVRAWAALRVMTPDGKPIYLQSEQYPGAYVATCHSGVTLAATHALRLPGWILDTEALPEISAFTANRFSGMS